MRRIAGIVLMLCAAAGAADPDLRELYERARMLREKNQNLAEAIRLYGQVVALGRAQHAIAATAQYEQGLLYERLGRKAEAQRAFRAVVRDFPDQKAVVAKALAKLPPGTPQTGARSRQVWTGEDVDTFGRVSRDGRLLSFTDWSTGDLAIHDLETGENRRVTKKGKSWRESHAQALWSLFSPDGRWLAYSWYEDNPPPELRVIRIDGSGQRTLLRAEDTDEVTVNDWSPDGKYVLASIKKPSADSEIRLISFADGSARVLASGMRLADGLFSRDGKYVAYNSQPPGGGNRAIRIVSTATGADAALVQNPADHWVLGWSPEGSKLLFGSDRSGSAGLWALPVLDGKPQGEAELLKANFSFESWLGITSQGALYNSVGTNVADVYLAEYDSGTGKISQPHLLSQRFAGAKYGVAWSPDGATLAYAAKGALQIFSLSTGQESELKPRMAGLGRVLKYHPDGRSVFVSGSGLDKWFGMYRVDLQTGEARLAAKISGERPAFSADARVIYGYLIGMNKLASYNLETGEEKVLYTRPQQYEIQNPNADLSPDGQTLVFQLQNVPKGYNSLVTMPVTGGTPRTLLQIPDSERFGPNALRWTPDMHYILVSRVVNKRSEVWRVPVDGGAPESTGLSMPGTIRFLRLHPDGRRLAFMGGGSGNGSEEIWVLENFLPRASGAPAKR